MEKKYRINIFNKDVDLFDESFVYVLICPIRNRIFYVGKANDLKTRYRKHISQSGKTRTRKNNYIKWLLKQGETPFMLAILSGAEKEILEWEKTSIALFRKISNPYIMNMTDGGDGGNTFGGRKHKQETKDKIGASKIGKPRDLSYLYHLKVKAINQIDPNTNQIIKTFESVIQAADATGLFKGDLARRARGVKVRDNLTGGFIWEYCNN